MSAETIPAETLALAKTAIARVEKTMCPTFASDAGDLGEQGRISRADLDILQIAILADRSTRPAEPAAPVAEAGDGETYYTKGKDADWFEGLSHQDAAWALTCAAMDLNDTGLGDHVDLFMPHNAMLSGAGDRIKNLCSALEAERARADELRRERDFWENRENEALHRLAAAEQRAADALARAEKAAGERDAYHDALTPGGDTKALMIGEFFEEIEVRNPDYDDESLDEDEDDEPEFITHRVPVSWTTTKAMMERLRSYAHRLSASREAQPATDGGNNG